ALEFVSKAEKPQNMVTVKGKEYSEDTVHLALKQYVK
ncbi:unnamed protein product, partial [marine sediment metagenome]